MKWLEAKISQEFKKDKWEVKTLGEIITSNISSGNTKITNIYKNDGSFPAISGPDVIESGGVIKEGKIFVNESLFATSPIIEKEDFLIVRGNLSEEQIGKSCAYLGDQNCAAGNCVVVIKHSQNPKYLTYIFNSQYVKKQIKGFCMGPAGMLYIKREDLLKIKLLIPDIETQNQMVAFLDKFVDLELKFKKEIEKRDIQYEYYKELIANIGTSNHGMVRRKDSSGIREE